MPETDLPPPAAPPAGTFTGIVVGDDGSGRALEAIRFAFAEAARRGTTVHVIRSWNVKNGVRPAGEEPGVVPSTAQFQQATTEATQARAEMINQEIPATFEVHAVYGAASKVLLAASQQADLIVVGDQGVGGVAARFLGSVADTVVREAACSVTVVRRRRSPKA